MPGCLTKTQTVAIHTHTLTVTSLQDRQQCDDEAAKNDNIPAALWPISGVLWPSGIILARYVAEHSLFNKKVLEIGCGVAIPSLVASKIGADVTATDFNPLAETFLKINVKANRVKPVRFEKANWNALKPLGSFDLIIGADLLYEEEHFSILAAFINLQAHQASTVVIVDPGRGYAGKFATLMQTYQWEYSVEMLPKQTVLGEALNKGRLMTFRRAGF